MTRWGICPVSIYLSTGCGEGRTESVARKSGGPCKFYVALMISARWQNGCAASLTGDGHALQPRDSIGEGRMSAEQAGEKLAAGEGRDDAQRGSGRRNIHGNSLVVGAELFKSAHQTVGMPDHLRARSVRLIFALTGNPQLKQCRGDRSQNKREQGRDSVASALVATPAAHSAENHAPATHVAKPSDGAGNRGGNRRSKDVVVADVGEFMGDHAFEFFVVHQFHQALRDGDGSVTRIPSGGKRVWRGLRNHVQLGHRQ